MQLVSLGFPRRMVVKPNLPWRTKRFSRDAKRDCGRNDRRRLGIDPGQSAAYLLPRPDDLTGIRAASDLKVVPCRPIIFLYFLMMRDGPVGSCMDSDIMTIREVAEYLKLTEKTAYRHVADGKIPGFKVGGGLAVPAQRDRQGGSSGSPPGRRNGEANNARVERRCRESRRLCPAYRGNPTTGFQAIRIWHGHSAIRHAKPPPLHPRSRPVAWTGTSARTG